MQQNVDRLDRRYREGWEKFGAGCKSFEWTCYIKSLQGLSSVEVFMHVLWFMGFVTMLLLEKIFQVGEEANDRPIWEHFTNKLLRRRSGGPNTPYPLLSSMVSV